MRLATLLGVVSLLLAGCTLGSDDSLVATSDTPAQATGHYELLVSGPADMPGDMKDDLHCLDPGSALVDPALAPSLGRGALYCSNLKADQGPPPRFLDIVANGTEFAVRVPDDSRVPDAALGLRFLRLADRLYLAQLDQGGRFDLWIARISPSGIELYALGCDDFPTGTVPYHPYAGTHGPPCSATSLDALRPGLVAYVAAMAAQPRLPFAVLKRVE